MPVGEPAQQGGDVATVIAGEVPGVVGVERVGQADQGGVQCRRVDGHLARVGEHVGQQLGGLGHRLGVHRRRQRDVDPRLVDAVAGCVRVGRGPHLEQLARRVPAHPEHRVHDRDVGDAEPMQQAP